jgi:hypothetical protein
MLNRSNIIALVGGGTNPAFPRNKVILWDQRDLKVVGEIVCPRDIHGIKVNTKWLQQQLFSKKIDSIVVL